MPNKTKRNIILFHLLLMLVITSVSCNSKTEDDEDDIAVTPALVAVKEFKLLQNISVMSGLDSVFFSIDLNSGVIFNADSLPKGTDVRKLVPSITFANTMTKADLTFRRENDKDTTVNYLTNATDTIDFTYPVKLEVTAQNGVNTFTYQIRVNVHTQDPDTIIWSELATSKLPSRFDNPVKQRTLVHDNIVYCLVEESNGEFTLSKSADLSEGIWDKQPFDPGFIPAMDEFVHTAHDFYLLDRQGYLYCSQDLAEWIKTGEEWVSIIGAYGKNILGIKEIDNRLMHAAYPGNDGFIEKEVEKGFPVYNTSPLGVINSEWADQPMALLVGGVDEYGEISDVVWAYDGDTWAIINEGVLPALKNPMLVRYVTYRDTPVSFVQREFDIWLLFGGSLENEEMNRNVYISYDNGVKWSLAPEKMQISATIPSLADADAIIAGYRLSADLSQAWTSLANNTRSDYTINGFEISWICPYLYIFGGYNPYPDSSLNTIIYRGVLERLKFTPSV